MSGDLEDFFRYASRPNPPAWALEKPAANPSMHVYIDDSGDPGMKLDGRSSPYIVMSACVFRDTKQLEQLSEISDTCALRRSHRTEFKYSKTKDKTKRLYFELIANLDFAVRVIYADKRKITSEKLRGDGSALKAYLIRQLLQSNFGQVTNAKVFVDGNDVRGFGIPDHQYLMGMVNKSTQGTVHSVKFIDSANSRPIQLADMTAGAVGRFLEAAKDNHARDFNTFRHRTWQTNGGTFWDFTR